MDTVKEQLETRTRPVVRWSDFDEKERWKVTAGVMLRILVINIVLFFVFLAVAWVATGGKESLL